MPGITAIIQLYWHKAKKKKIMHKANTQGKKDKYSNREDDFCAMLSILKYKTSN